MIDKKHIGMELEPVTFPVERGKIRELARAIHDDNPVYFSSEHPPAPLIFSRTFIAWSDNLVNAFAEIGVDLSRILHGGFELEYLEPVNAGDTLTMTGRLADVYVKQSSRGGELEFIVFDWEFTNQHGRVAIRSRNTTIQTASAAQAG